MERKDPVLCSQRPLVDPFLSWSHMNSPHAVTLRALRAILILSYHLTFKWPVAFQVSPPVFLSISYGSYSCYMFYCLILLDLMVIAIIICHARAVHVEYVMGKSKMGQVFLIIWFPCQYHSTTTLYCHFIHMPSTRNNICYRQHR
jgi:hypothetical protein